MSPTNDRGQCPHCHETIERDELLPVHEGISVESVEAFHANDRYVTVHVEDLDGNAGSFECAVDDVGNYLNGWTIEEEDVEWN